MSWRGTVLLILLAGMALGFLILSDHSKTHPPQEPLLGINPSMADGIEIHEGGNFFAIFKWNENWIVKKHLENGAVFRDRANPQLIHALLEAAAEIVPLDILRPRDFKEGVTLPALGLKKPNRAITLHAGKTEMLWIGTEGAAPGSLYVRLDSGKSIYLISGKIATIAFHSAQEYRDPRLTALATNRIDEISIFKGGSMQQLNLKKKNGSMTGPDADWLLESPLSAKGDDKIISSLLDTLLGAPIIRWMPEGTDLSSCGLDTPSAIIKIHEEGTPTPVTISIGAAVPGASDNYFVRCSDRPGICVVGEAIKIFLTATPQSVRSKTISSVEYDTVDKIEIYDQVNLISLTRKPGSEDWNLQHGAEGVIPGSRVKDWFDRFQKLSAESFEPATAEHLNDHALGPQCLPIVVSFIAKLSENTAQENAGETKLAQYVFGEVRENHIAMREGNSNELMILPSGTIDLIKNEPLSWAAPAIPSPTPSLPLPSPSSTSGN